MSKTKAILLAAFVLAFAAGASTGLFVGRPTPATHRSLLAQELGLTPEQSEKMQRIWSDAMPGGGRQQRGERRAAAAAERDQAVQALLSQTQRAQYDAILQAYQLKLDEMDQERRRAFDEAVERTKQILTPEQAQKYEDWLKKQRERGGGPGFRGPRHPHTAPATKPMIDEQTPPRSGA